MGTNYRCEPLRERAGDPVQWFSSAAHGDPVTPLLRTYPGEPVWLRLLQGAHEEMHSFTVNGIRWRRFRGDPRSPQRAQQTIALSEAFTFVIDPGYGAGDHLWRLAGVDDTWLGCWGVLRSHPAPERDLPSLAEITGGQEVPAAEPAAGPTRRFTVVAERRVLAYRDDLVDRFGLVYRATSTTPPGGDRHDYPAPAGDAPVEPLVLRCLVGETVEIELHNGLDPDEALEPEPNAPAIPIDLPAGARTVSSHVSLHADLVGTDVTDSDGSWVGLNPSSTVAPGARRTLRWRADVEPGPVPLHDLADVRNHRHHGLVGALVVEPAGALPEVPGAADGEPAWTDVRATVRGPEQEEREEVVLVLQDGLRLFLDDNLAAPFPDGPADPGEEGPDPEDQGQQAVNYRADPTGPARGWLADPLRAAVYEVPAGRPVSLHVVGGFDKPRNHSLTVHGATWPEYPHLKDSTRIAAEGGLSVNTARTWQLPPLAPGDHAVRSGALSHAVGQGLWAVLRVQESHFTVV